MADGAYLPPRLPDGCTGLAGYLASLNRPGPYHAWTAGEWARAVDMLRVAGGGFLLPIYLPGPGENPTSAARWAVSQAANLGQPPGTVIVLDREENRADLDAGWCWAFHDGLVGQGYIPCGYTSSSTTTVFAGWSLRWIARVGAETVAPGDAATQYALDVPGGGGTVDLSWVSDTLPAWPVVVRPAPVVNHGGKPVYVAHSATRQVQVFDTGRAVELPAPGDGSVLTSAPLNLPYVGPFTEEYLNRLLTQGG